MTWILVRHVDGLLMEQDLSFSCQQILRLKVGPLFRIFLDFVSVFQLHNAATPISIKMCNLWWAWCQCSFPLVCSEFTTIASMWPYQLQISTLPIMMCCRRLQDSRSDIDFTSCFTYSTTMLYVRSSPFPDLAIWDPAFLFRCCWKIKNQCKALFIYLFSKEHALLSRTICFDVREHALVWHFFLLFSLWPGADGGEYYSHVLALVDRIIAEWRAETCGDFRLRRTCMGGATRWKSGVVSTGQRDEKAFILSLWLQCNLNKRLIITCIPIIKFGIDGCWCSCSDCSILPAVGAH